MDGTWDITGRWERSLDDKGRIILPPQPRDFFRSNPGFLGFGQDGCIDLLPPETHRKDMEKRLAKKRTKLGRNQLRALTNRMQSCNPDTQARVKLPESLMEQADLSPGQSVLLIGAGDRYEVWNAERFDILEADALASLLEGDEDEE